VFAAIFSYPWRKILEKTHPVQYIRGTAIAPATRPE
jgi:hypothetical protein